MSRENHTGQCFCTICTTIDCNCHTSALIPVDSSVVFGSKVADTAREKKLRYSILSYQQFSWTCHTFSRCSSNCTVVSYIDFDDMLCLVTESRNCRKTIAWLLTRINRRDKLCTGLLSDLKDTGLRPKTSHLRRASHKTWYSVFLVGTCTLYARVQTLC